MPTLADFLSRALPWPAPGQPGVASLHWRSWKGRQVTSSKPFTTLADMLSFIEWSLGAGNAYIRELYFCTSIQKGPGPLTTGDNPKQTANRLKENILHSKALFADIDKGYESPAHAAAAVVAMCKATASPTPSALVVSGNGLHVYWFSTVALSPDEWSRYARALDALLTTHGITHDAVTTDITRILRPPGTFNNKGHEKGISPKPVVLEFLAPADIDFSTWDALKAAAAAQLTSQGLVAPKHKIPLEELFVNPAEANVPPSKLITASLKPEDWIGQTLDPTQVFQCPMFKHTLETHGAEVAQPLWNQQALACTFLRDGEALFHELSKGHRTYTYADADAMFARKVRERVTRDFGYPSCATFEREGSKQCATCPLRGTIRSPLSLRSAAAKFDAAREASRLAPPLVPTGSPLVPTGSEATGWSAAELQVSFSNIPHRRWLYGTYLIREEITVLAAPGGAGKTALATGMAAEIAAGSKKLGETLWRSNDQRVLYLNGEDSGTEITRRLWAFCQQHNISEQDLARLSVAAADNALVQSMSFFCVNENGATVLNEGGFNSLQSALEALRPDLLVLDPLVVLCGGGDMNDWGMMSLVMRRLKALAVKFDCAILVVHHTRKGRTTSDDPAEEAERISGAAAIVNLARRALMPMTMTEAEAKLYSVLPSQRLQYFKLVDAKSNLAPLSTEKPWYELASQELPNSEPPMYPNGDRVQAVKRTQLTRQKAASSRGPEEEAIRFELMKLIDRGLTIDEERVPYSPNSTGNNKQRAILDHAMVAVEEATPDREWLSGDLRATVERELEALKQEGWVIVEKIKNGRFRRGYGLQPVWARTPWTNERENLRQHGGPTIRTEQEQCELIVSEITDGN